MGNIKGCGVSLVQPCVTFCHPPRADRGDGIDPRAFSVQSGAPFMVTAETSRQPRLSEISMRLAAAFFLSLSALAAPAAAQDGAAPLVSPILTSEEAKDPWTFAEPEVARVTHVKLDLTLDFEGRA